MFVKLMATTVTIASPEWFAPGYWWADDQVTSAEGLIEAAGRNCYQSWDRPNPATATSEGYIENLLKQGHFSVLEHASVTFLVGGVSRSLTHELVRHRHLSFSQLSQRYVDETDASFVPPPAITGDPELLDIFNSAVNEAVEAYGRIVDKLMADGLSRKEARQAARAVLPNATSTRIVVTGNLRAWRHFLAMRGGIAADMEIRQLAVEIAGQLKEAFPYVFGDVEIDSDKRTVEMKYREK